MQLRSLSQVARQVSSASDFAWPPASTTTSCLIREARMCFMPYDGDARLASQRRVPPVQCVAPTIQFSRSDGFAKTLVTSIGFARSQSHLSCCRPPYRKYTRALDRNRTPHRSCPLRLLFTFLRLSVTDLRPRHRLTTLIRHLVRLICRQAGLPTIRRRSRRICLYLRRAQLSSLTSATSLRRRRSPTTPTLSATTIDLRSERDGTWRRSG